MKLKCCLFPRNPTIGVDHTFLAWPSQGDWLETLSLSINEKEGGGYKK